MFGMIVMYLQGIIVWTTLLTGTAHFVPSHQYFPGTVLHVGAVSCCNQRVATDCDQIVRYRTGTHLTPQFRGAIL